MLLFRSTTIPTYFYKCTSCENVREDICSIRTFESHEPPCTECGKVCKYTFIATVPQVAFKDGPSGSWPSKGERVKKQRQKASEDAGRRQVERYGKNPNKLVPNYEGKQLDSWHDAKSIALQEKGPEAAATYDNKIQTEKAETNKT